MSSWSATSRRGALAGLALLFALSVVADDSLRASVREELRDESYVLVEDQAGARLYVLPSTGDGYRTRWLPSPPGSPADALGRTYSADARTRVRALTELSGVDDAAALNAALTMLSDPDEAVREEAVNLVLEHPSADKQSVIAIARRDPSERVRDVVAEFLDEDPDDEPDKE